MRYWSRPTISVTSGEPTASSPGSIDNDWKKPKRSLIASAVRSAIDRSPIRTARDSGRRRDPPHAVHGTSSRYASRALRIGSIARLLVSLLEQNREPGKASCRFSRPERAPDLGRPRVEW